MRKVLRSTRLAAVVAATAVAAVGLLATSAEALPPLTPPAGALTISPTTGTAATAFSLAVPGGAACSADSASGNTFESTFMINSAADASQLTFPGGNPTLAAATFVQPLFTAGSPEVNMTTVTSTGAVTNLTPADLSVFPNGFVPAGQYKIGVACFLGDATGTIDKFWQTTINVTVAAGAITGFSLFAAPSAPTLASPLTAASGSLSGTFTAIAATPPATTYTVSAAPQPTGTAITTSVATPGAFTIPGLTNGVSYSVTVTATNPAGTSAPSNAVTGTPVDPNQRPPVTSLAASPGTGNVVLTWVAPTGTGTINSYTIGVSPTVAGAPFTTVGPVLTFTVSGLAAGTLYTFTVTANYAGAEVATPASVTATPFGSSIIIQDISVTRPAGALVLTQRCGVFGALPSEAPNGFGTIPAATAVGGTGTAPLLTWPGGTPDALFPQYPYPVDANGVPNPVYPTHCGVDLGKGQLITTGTEAGKYFTAVGRINQVTLVDTRDSDSAWAVNGTMSAFASGVNNFTGNYLGWTPVVTSDSGVTFAGYNQTAVAGAIVAPSGSSATGPTVGLGTSKELAHAVAGQGLGIAVLDARLKLFIPVTAKNGVYTGTLTFTAV